MTKNLNMIWDIKGLGKNMNAKKLTAILMCMLMIGLIPVAAGATNHTPTSTAIGGTTLVGFVVMKRDIMGSKYFTFRCIWVHYISHDLAQRKIGVLHGFQKIELRNDYVGWVGNFFVFAHFDDYLVHH